jgi:hypothetical protein
VVELPEDPDGRLPEEPDEELRVPVPDDDQGELVVSDKECPGGTDWPPLVESPSCPSSPEREDESLPCSKPGKVRLEEVAEGFDGAPG